MPKILHFGVGNFFRAHLAAYTNGLEEWEILGVSLRAPGVRDGLSAQGYEYTLAVQGQSAIRITAMTQILVAPEDPRAVLDAIVDPDVEILSLTVTEKGYHLDADGHLDLEDPAISFDLKSEFPQTTIGYLARGLARRDTPLTVLSCDNRLGNGAALESAVRAFASQSNLEVNWENLSFPNSMVDRITPATTDALRVNFDDPMVDPTEPFSEWVIEDRFVGMRPNWDGVQFVQDVGPHEMRKLRMLNGAHSALAYAGSLVGLRFVHEAIADPTLRALASEIMVEASETLPATVKGQAPVYADALVKRFENPDLAHSLRQIAMDGSQKLPYRFADTMRARAEMGIPSPWLSKAVRAWIAFVREEVAAGRALQDPKAEELAVFARERQDDAVFFRLVGIDPKWLS